MSGFRLDREDYLLEYEGLHLLCTKCGRYGHKAEECSFARGQAMQSKDMDNGDGVKDQQVDDGSAQESTEGEKWKVVQKPHRQRKPREKQSERGWSSGSGSRFGVLYSGEEGKENIANGEMENEVAALQDDRDIQRGKAASTSQSQRPSGKFDLGIGQKKGTVTAFSKATWRSRQRETRAEKRTRGVPMKEWKVEVGHYFSCRQKIRQPWRPHAQLLMPLWILGAKSKWIIICWAQNVIPVPKWLLMQWRQTAKIWKDLWAKLKGQTQETL